MYLYIWFNKTIFNYTFLNNYVHSHGNYISTYISLTCNSLILKYNKEIVFFLIGKVENNPRKSTTKNHNVLKKNQIFGKIF